MNDGTARKISVVSLHAGNLPETAHFYRDVLGLRLVHHSVGGRPHFDVGGVFLVLLPGSPPPASQDRFPQIAFAVDDLESAVNNLQSHQVRLPWGVEGDGRTRWVMFYDPAGNLIELVQFGNSISLA
jgi:catechol 2,3-dioxygenase-like lactoylglutathione lyase family enzyme